jgi:hypothetical protein
MEQNSSGSTNWFEIASSMLDMVCQYDVSDGQLVLSDYADGGYVFFSRKYIDRKNAVICPLWEGDLREILIRDEISISLIELLRKYRIKSTPKLINYCAIEFSEWPYQPGIAARRVACRAFDNEDEVSKLFVTTSSTVSYWGVNFFWPTSADICIYSDGDQISFVAGPQKDLEEYLGVSVDYCINRFAKRSPRSDGWPPVVQAYLSFCSNLLSSKKL